MSATPAKPNIHQRLHAVMKAVKYVQKDKTVGEGKSAYRAVTHDNVVAEVREHFLEHGIAMSLTMVSGQTVDTTKKTSSGTPIIRFEGVFNVTFTNVDDPTDFVTETIPGQGEDTGDKATGKAVSYAKKYALLTVLMLETGENDESRTAAAGEPEAPTGLADGPLALFNELVAKAKTQADLQEAQKAFRKELVKVAGSYKGHPQWTSYYDSITKRNGQLVEAAKAVAAVGEAG